MVGTSNRCTESLYVSTVTARRRAITCRDRHTMIVMLQVLTVGTARPSHGEGRKDIRMRACSGQRSPEPSKWVVPTASVRCLGARATCGHWLIKAAGSSRDVTASLSVNLVWNAQASRPCARALRHHTRTSHEATTGGMAYGEHRKAAVGWTEGRASAPSGLYHG